LGFIFWAAVPLVWKVILAAVHALSFADELRKLHVDDSISVNGNSVSIRSYSLFRFHTKVCQADEIRVLGFYPTFLGEQASFKAAMMVKSRMIPLLYLEGPEAAEVFDELGGIPWLAPKILRMERPVFFQAKERQPLKAAWCSVKKIWPNFKALMSKPVRFPRL